MPTLESNSLAIAPLRMSPPKLQVSLQAGIVDVELIPLRYLMPLKIDSELHAAHHD